MVKPRSETAVAARAAEKKPEIPPEVADRLADEMADRPYGRAKEVEDTPPPARRSRTDRDPKCRPISISLPETMIKAMENAAMDNKRRGKGPVKVSQMIRMALEKDGWKA